MGFCGIILFGEDWLGRVASMHKKLFSVLYAINIISQAIFTLLLPAALGFCLSWLFVAKLGAPRWLYAVLITVGVITGLVSMVKFSIAAAEGLERLDKQNKNSNKTGHNKNEK